MKKILFVVLFLGLVPLTSNAKEDFSDCDFVIYNNCVSCDEPLSFNVGLVENCTAKCPNREINTELSGSAYSTINCYLKECPPDRPFQNQIGSCLSEEYKDSEDLYNFSHRPPSDRKIINFNLDKNTSIKANSNKCPKEKPLRDWDNNCWSCDVEHNIAVDSRCNFEDCNDVCPNRVVAQQIGGNPPSVLKCPKDRPLMDSEGVCYSCKYEGLVNLRYNRDDCEKICPNERVLRATFCQPIDKSIKENSPENQKFFNPIFYEVMENVTFDDVTIRVTPNSLTEASSVRKAETYNCELVENKINYIRLKCDDPFYRKIKLELLFDKVDKKTKDITLYVALKFENELPDSSSYYQINYNKKFKNSKYYEKMYAKYYKSLGKETILSPVSYVWTFASRVFSEYCIMNEDDFDDISLTCAPEITAMGPEKTNWSITKDSDDEYLTIHNGGSSFHAIGKKQIKGMLDF